VPAGDNVAGVDEDVETRLRAALRDALKTRDVVAAFAVRSALGAIGNAGAVPAGEGSATPVRTGSAYVARATAGAGATEVSRRQLSPAGLRALVEAEISERQAAAGQYEQTGQADRAETLRREARVLQAVLDG
jgi:uncharacterized protein YqeY